MNKPTSTTNNQSYDSVSSSTIIPTNKDWINGNYINKNQCEDLLPFPLKLHTVLDEAETKGFDGVISWHSGGESFKVHDPIEFCKHIMPNYFRSQSKFKSFQRQLNLYGFERIAHGTWKGYYRHDLFIRGQKERCSKMKLQKIKGTQKRDALSSMESAKKRDSLSSLDTTKSSKVKTTPTPSRNSSLKSKIPDERKVERKARRVKSSSFEGRRFFTV